MGFRHRRRTCFIPHWVVVRHHGDGVLKALSKLRVNGDDEVRELGKADKTRTVRAIFFPADGRNPYPVDVEVEPDGTFDIDDGRKGYALAKGSVWREGTRLYTIVNERNPQTVNADILTGRDIMHPIEFQGYTQNNLWCQLDEIARRKSQWRSATTWGLMLMGVGILLLLLWQVKTIGSGFEELRAALEGIGVTTGGTHQPIAPR